MPDPKLDQQLREFLASTEQDRAEGNTIANLRLEVGQVRTEVHEMQAEQRLMKLRLDRHGKDIGAIKRHLEWGEDVDTGQHQVADLQRELARRTEELQHQRESGIWWKRRWVSWAVAAVASLASIFLVSLLGALGFFIAKAFGGK